MRERYSDTPANAFSAPSVGIGGPGIDHVFKSGAQRRDFSWGFAFHRFRHQIGASGHDSTPSRFMQNLCAVTLQEHMDTITAHRVVALGIGIKHLEPPGEAWLARAVHDQGLVEFRGVGHQLKICLTRLRPTASASISSGSVYSPNEARAVLLTPSRPINGSAQ